MRLLLCCTLLAAAVSSSWSPARADEATGENDLASEAFARGKKLFEQRRYVNAIAAFKEAYRVRPHFIVQCSIARAYENLSNVVKAAEHYRRCLEEGAKDNEAMAGKVRASLAAVEERITWVEINSPGKGGKVYVDGQPVGTAPQRVPFNPGQHVVEVRRKGAQTASTTVQTLGGETKTIKLVPKDEAAPATQAVANVRPEPAGPERRKLAPLWFWSAVGLTGALAVVTTVLGIQTLGARSDYEDEPTESGLDRFKDYRLATNVMVGLTAAAAGGTAVLFFYTDFSSKERAGDGRQAMTVGLGIRGTF
jgi:hypothetical protein